MRLRNQPAPTGLLQRLTPCALLACVLASPGNASAKPPKGTPIDNDVAQSAVAAPSTAVDPQLAMLAAQKARESAALAVRPNAALSPSVAASNGAQQASVRTQGGSVRIEAMSKSSDTALIDELATAGASQLKVRGNLVVGVIPVSKIAALQSVASARFVRPAWEPQSHTGTVNSQGDAAEKSDVARSTYRVDGTGVTVGITSTAYNTLGGAAKDIATGNLPGPGNAYGHTAPVNLLKERTTSDGDDEGRAMAQIVHDVAPGAKLAVYIPEDIFDHAAGLRALSAAGARVISDDLYWFNEPWFQMGPIERAQRDILAKDGTVTFTAAGNEAAESREGTFSPLGLHHIYQNGASIGRYTLHDWGGGASTFPIVLHRGSNIAVVLQWDEPYASSSTTRQGSASDLDLFAFDDTQGVNMRFGSNARNVNGDPIELLYLFLDDNAASESATVNVGVGQPYKVGAQPGKFKIVIYESGNPVDLPAAFNKPTILAHAASEFAGSTCAVDYSQVNTVNGPRVENFSSLGGFARTRDETGARLPSPLNTMKPDLCAPDGVNTTFFGGGDTEKDGYPNFYGTSAASPHLAGVAALMMQASKFRIPASQIVKVMKANTIDMDNPSTPNSFDRGYDVKTGAGLIQADKAVKAAQSYP